MTRRIPDMTSGESAAHAFGAELRQQRIRCGLSMRTLGEMIGCSYELIRRVEKAERSPTVAFCEKVDAALKTNQFTRMGGAFPEKRGKPSGSVPRALADEVHKIRANSGLTQNRFGAEIGYSKETVGRIENGHLWPSPEFCTRVDRAMKTGGRLACQLEKIRNAADAAGRKPSLHQSAFLRRADAEP